MAWEVAVILNPKCEQSTVEMLAKYMPLWIADTPSNQECAATARQVAGDLWKPKASCTTFTTYAELSTEDNFVNIAKTVGLHHPNLAKFNLLGIETSDSLKSRMRTLGFLPAKATWDDALSFRKPVSALNDVPHLTLDAKSWRSSGDVYEDLFNVLGSPAWHGKNFDALHDSIVTGQINSLEVPYTLSICGMSSAKPEVRLFVKHLIDLISRFESEGCPISIRIKN